jgi:hypothetical protein
MKKYRIPLCLLSVICFLFADCFVSYAQSPVYGCVKKKGGYLRVVSDLGQCKSTENPVTFDQGAASQGVKVYDAAGQYLGVFQESGEELAVYIPSLKKEAYFAGGDISGCVYYANNDCTGQAFVDNTTMQVLRGFGRKYYIHDGSAMGSYYVQSYSCGYGCYEQADNFIGTKFTEVTLPFQTPINVPVLLDPAVIPSLPRLTLQPYYTIRHDPDIGSSVTFTINGGTPPFSVFSYDPNITVPGDMISGPSFNATLISLPSFFYYGDYSILITDSAGISAMALLSYSFSPLQVTPSTQTIIEPSVGSTATFTLTGGRKQYGVMCTSGYVTCVLDESIVTVTVSYVPDTDQTISIYINDPGSSTVLATLILDVP